ncbi:MAG: carboxypeptidase-like regulatory domain-containing protein, partial [Flavisolibacter sp.]|nr:carboxypeptidase-like regulatory domain-containing protein [Flavisolibacter sp.]
MRKILLFSMALLFAIQLWAQRTVSGIVRDERGTPLPSISVQIKGTNIGTATNNEGSYTLTVPANGRTLVFSSVDMGTQEIDISNRTTINVSMQTAQRNLEEVVVVGYGTQRRREVTGSVASISGNKLRDQPLQSFEQGLSGRAAGINISIPNGVLGNAPIIRVRGINSISLSSYPLVVIDGVPSFTGDIGSGTSANNLLGD